MAEDVLITTSGSSGDNSVATHSCGKVPPAQINDRADPHSRAGSAQATEPGRSGSAAVIRSTPITDESWRLVLAGAVAAVSDDGRARLSSGRRAPRNDDASDKRLYYCAALIPCLVSNRRHSSIGPRP